ncbi:MAG: carbohydrate ABC transporter permease [Desulfobacteraceae bacterium]|nr:carbohydrate ABC transporter permease [Desulfobacteraceae bacterium]
MARKPYGTKAYIRLVVLIVVSILALFPVYWMISTAFKPMDEWTSFPPVWLTKSPTLDNFLSIMGFLEGSTMNPAQSGAGPAFFKGLFVSVSATLVSLGAGSMAAYAISRYTKMFGNFLPLFILSARMFPPIAVLIPLIVMYSYVGGIDSFWGLIVAYAGFTLPFSVWMMKSFIDDVPREIEEAAIMEGMGNFEVFYKVTLPITKTGLFVTALFVFILNWSEFLVAVSTTYDRVQTAPIFLATLFSAVAGTLYGPQAAMGLLIIIPTVIFGYLIQKHLARGFTFGALKR